MPFLEFRQITKRFPGVLALDGVSLTVERGTCHALIGENGAGKSTLGKILAGVYTADSGQIFINGRPVAPTTPLAARELGIAMVHQELAFCPNLSVAENLCLGDLPRRRGFIDRSALRARARALLAAVGADIDPDIPIGTLSTGREQLVQIAAAVGTGAQIIVMDEPTSSLSAAETADLFRLVRELKARGLTLIYVSHRLEELFALCDHITVLRDGRHIATEAIASTTPARVVTQMIGRELRAHTPVHLARELGPVRLSATALTSPGHFTNIPLSVRAGEIVALPVVFRELHRVDAREPVEVTVGCKAGACRALAGRAIEADDHAAVAVVALGAEREQVRQEVRGDAALLCAGLGVARQDAAEFRCHRRAPYGVLLPATIRQGWLSG